MPSLGGIEIEARVILMCLLRNMRAAAQGDKFDLDHRQRLLFLKIIIPFSEIFKMADRILFYSQRSGPVLRRGAGPFLNFRKRG